MFCQQEYLYMGAREKVSWLSLLPYKQQTPVQSLTLYGSQHCQGSLQKTKSETVLGIAQASSPQLQNKNKMFVDVKNHLQASVVAFEPNLRLHQYLDFTPLP